MCIVFLADIVLGLGFQVLFHQIPFCEFSDKERTPKNVDSIFVQSVGKYKQTNKEHASIQTRRATSVLDSFLPVHSQFLEAFYLRHCHLQTAACGSSTK